MKTKPFERKPVLAKGIQNLVLATFLSGIFVPIAVAQRGATPAPAGQRGAPPAPAAQAPRGKMTLGSLINDIKEVAPGRKDPAQVERDVRERGVDFEATEYILETLRSVGAWAEIRSLVSRYDTKTTAPPPPPKSTGQLTVACEPVDCRVIVRSSEGTTLSARTEAKSRVFESVPTGTIEIVTSADGHLEKSHTVELASGASLKASFVLEPLRNPGLGRVLGKAVLFEVFEATSQVDAIEGRAGTLDWRGPDGVDHAWSVDRFVKKAGADLSITFQSRDGGGSCTVAIGARPRTACQRSLRGYDKDAEKAAQLFLKYQPYDFVRSLPKGAAESLETDATLVTFKGADGVQSTIKINNESLLAEVVHQLPKEPSRTITYSHYLNPDGKQGSAQYPMWIQISEGSTKTNWDFRIDGVRRP